MQLESASTGTSTQPTSITRYRAPIWTLLILAPVISEVLSGSTRLSVLFVLVPEIAVWGGAALLARELARRWRAGAVSLLLLGLAVSVAEEFIIQQTSIAPLPFIGANPAYGRYLGINWLYLLFMLGYESVWVVLVPVQVTELLFPAHREKPWLRKRGLIAMCIVFLFGCRIAWFGWTQKARPSLHAAPYHPPAALILAGLAAIAALIFLAWLLRRYGHSGRVESRRPANPWMLGATALVMGSAWWELITLIFVPHPHPPVWIPLAAGVVWSLLALALLLRWSVARGWGDTHRWALCVGATLACMLPGYISLAGWSRPDLIFRIIVNLAAAIAMLLLTPTIARRHSLSTN